MFNPFPTDGVIKETLSRHFFKELYLLKGSLKVYDFTITFDEALIELSNGMQAYTICRCNSLLIGVQS